MSQPPQQPEQPGAAAAEAERPGSLPFPVVAIGASAGGLEPLSTLLEVLPAQPGLAVIVVMHLSPHAKSELPHILARVSAMPVRVAAGGTRVEVDHVYVGPPGSSVVLVDGEMTLLTRPP